jgi:hypothetical protein
MLRGSFIKIPPTRRESLRKPEILWHTRMAKDFSREFCMSLESHLVVLEQRHEALDKEIEQALLHPSFDELKLAELKRRKLLIKDEIVKLKGESSLATMH